MTLPPPEPETKVQSVDVWLGSSTQDIPLGSKATVAAAPVPPPPERATVGGVVQELPAVVMMRDVTAPDATVVDPVGSTPHPPPENVTEGAPVYPEPGAVIVGDVIDPETPAIKFNIGSWTAEVPETWIV